jgi:hypothetical protein
MQVYADFVLNHNSGADATELNPVDKQTRWTIAAISGRRRGVMRYTDRKCKCLSDPLADASGWVVAGEIGTAYFSPKAQRAEEERI